MDWKTYQETTAGLEPRPLLAQALPYVSSKSAALDLGAGAFRDTQTLIDAGFERIVALDQKFHVPAPSYPQLEVVEAKVEEYALSENTFDLISAQYSLPFISRSAFDTTWQRILQSLADRGVITGQFFGDRDAWAYKDDIVCFNKAKIDELLSSLEVLAMSEEEHEESTVAGEQKYWHVFNFIAKKA